MHTLIKGGVAAAFLAVLVLVALPLHEACQESPPPARPAVVIEIPANLVLAVPAPGFPQIPLVFPWSPRPLEETLRDMLEEYVARGWLPRKPIVVG